MYLRIDSIAENGECKITKVNGDLVIHSIPQDIPTKTKGHIVLGYNLVEKQCKPCTYKDGSIND